MAIDLDTDDEVRRELDVRVGLGLSASDAQVSHLLAIAHQVEVAAGDLLYQRGAPVTRLFQLTGGAIEMSLSDQPTWRLNGTGTAGLIDFLCQRPHTRTAVATAPARLLVLAANDYREYLEDNFEVCARIISRLSSEITDEIIKSPQPSRFLARAEPSVGRSFANIEIPVVDRLVMLSRLPAFAAASIQALANLAQSAAEVRFAPGEVIAPAGSKATALMVLIEGHVELALPNGARVDRSGQDFLAHVSELSTTRRKLGVTAITPSIVLQIDHEDLLDRLEEHFDLAMAVLAHLAREQERLNDEAAARGLAIGNSSDD